MNLITGLRVMDVTMKVITDVCTDSFSDTRKSFGIL